MIALGLIGNISMVISTFFFFAEIIMIKAFRHYRYWQVTERASNAIREEAANKTHFKVSNATAMVNVAYRYDYYDIEHSKNENSNDAS